MESLVGTAVALRNPLFTQLGLYLGCIPGTLTEGPRTIRFLLELGKQGRHSSLGTENPDNWSWEDKGFSGSRAGW